MLFSTVALPIYIPISGSLPIMVAFSPHTLQHVLFVGCFDGGYSDWHEVISGSFDLYFSHIY